MCTCAVPKPVRNQLRSHTNRPPQKQSSVSVQASSTDFNDGESNNASYSSSKIAQFAKAKVDTWRTKTNQDELKKRRATALDKPKKQAKPKGSDGENNFNKSETEKVLQEVNHLLTMSQTDQNINSSKCYLRSVQRALNRNIKKGTFKNDSSVDPKDLRLAKDPMNMQRKGKYIMNERPRTISNVTSFPLPSCSESDNSRDTEGDITFNSRNNLNLYRTVHINRDSPEKSSEEEDGNASKVRTLLSFWNEKFATRPMTVCNDMYNPQRYMSLAKNRTKSAVKLSSDGVAEEHTLKPSQLKFCNKGATTIVEMLKLNSRRDIRKTISQSIIKESGYDKEVVRKHYITPISSNEQFIRQSRENTISNKRVDSKEKFIEIRNTLLKKQSTFHQTSKEKGFANRRNKWVTNYLKSVDEFNKQTGTQKTSVLYTMEMLKKENFIPITYPYLYIVKCLVEYTQETDSLKCLFKPGIFRPMPLMDPYDYSAYDYNEKYFNFRDRNTLRALERGGRGDDYKLNVDKISIITGIKPDVLNTLLNIANKRDMYKLSRSDLEKLYDIGSEATIARDSSFKDTFLFYLDNIENSFSCAVKDVVLKTISHLRKLPPIKEFHFGPMDKLLVQRERVYVTLTLSVFLMGLMMVLAASI